MANEESTEVSIEDILMDVWEKSYRTEAMLRVMIRNQAELLSKAQGVDAEEIINRINDEVNDELTDLMGNGETE